MNWQLFVAISVISNAITSILLRLLLKKENSHAIAFSIMYQLITGSVIFIYALFNGFKIPNIFHLVLYSIRPIVTVVASIIFLGEIINIKQIIGATLILISVVLVSWHSKKIKIFKKGAIFTVISAFAYGLAITGDSYVIRNIDIASYQTFAFIVPALTMLLIFPSSKFYIKKMFNFPIFSKLLILCIFQAIATITVFTAYKIGRNNVQIAPLTQLSTIIIVLSGIVILKERKNIFQKIIGAILSFFGTIMLK